MSKRQNQKTKQPSIFIKDQKGMTLIDVSIALLVIGLLIAPIFFQLKTYKADQVRLKSTDNIAAIDGAIIEYFSTNNFYPCPANPLLPETAPNHGDSVIDAGGLGTCQLAEGSVPHTELGIDIKKTYDGWGNKILYAVDPSRASVTGLAAAPTFAAAQAITIEEVPLAPHPTQVNAIGNPCEMICANTIAGYTPGNNPVCNPALFNPPALETTTNIHYTLLSHGSDGRGAFTEAGIPMACNPGASADSENCDGDAVYRTRQCMNTDSNVGAYYDDYIVVAAAQKNTDQNGMFSQSENNANGIAVESEFVGIRNSNPQHPLDVVGNIMVSDLAGIAGDAKDGAARSDDYCDPTGADCFDSELIGGSRLATPCSAGATMVGIANNAAVCRRVVSTGTTPTNCANGVLSVTIGGAVICAP